MRRRTIFLLLAAALVASLAVAQQVKKSRTATVTAQSMDFDWNTNTFVFSGNAKLTIGGDMNATMVSPSVTFTFDDKARAIKNLVAKGPVQFTVVTRPSGENNVQRKIVASASEQATYSEDTQVIKLSGSAVADMMPVDGSAEAVHFTGQTITANLQTNRLSVDNANVTVQTETNGEAAQ